MLTVVDISTKLRNASDFVDLCAAFGYTAEEHIVQAEIAMDQGEGAVPVGRPRADAFTKTPGQVHDIAREPLGKTRFETRLIRPLRFPADDCRDARRYAPTCRGDRADNRAWHDARCRDARR